jgi:hypothetical protein
LPRNRLTPTVLCHRNRAVRTTDPVNWWKPVYQSLISSKPYMARSSLVIDFKKVNEAILLSIISNIYTQSNLYADALYHTLKTLGLCKINQKQTQGKKKKKKKTKRHIKQPHGPT